MPKILGNNRSSAVKRLSNPYSTTKIGRRPVVGGNSSSISDARQILVNRNQTSFDARQLLSRQTSKNDANDDKMVVVTGLKDVKMKDGRLVPTSTVSGASMEKNKAIYTIGTSTMVTIRNNNGNNTSSSQATDKITLTKTIKNTSVRRDDAAAAAPPSASNQKVLISFVNDKYEKNPSPPPSSKQTSSSFVHHRDPPPVIKRSHDASIQTTTSSSSSSRSPIRMSSYRRQTSPSSDDYNQSNERTIGDELYEPAVKRTMSSTRKTATKTTEREQQAVPTGSVKRTSTGAPVSSRITSSASTVPKESSSSTSGTILVTNLQPSVTEEDVIELFGQIGRITEIKTLSEGCVRIIYAKREHAEQAVTKYHNRLLDGQFMYVSLQQTSSHSAPPQPSKPKSVIQQATKETGTSSSTSSTSNQPLKFNSSTSSSSSSSSSSNKFTIDPTFFRQALFHPTNNSNNPVQFQVKL